MNNQRLNYFLNSARRYFSPKKCPSCGSNGGIVADRKFIVTRLIKCSVCNLNYRHPLDSATFNTQFYNKDYVESDGITTELPNEIQLIKWMENGFAGSAKDMSAHIHVFNALFNKLDGVRIIDYGANWGYGSYQFREKGMIVDSYELARDRAKFGRKLNLEIKTNEANISGDNDIFYSSHVIEHLPSIPNMLAVAKKSLSQDGYFIAFCPNGSKEFRQAHSYNFHKCWGLVHPNYLSADYYQYIFKDNPYYIGSCPYDLTTIREFENRQLTGNLAGEELIVVAKINRSLKVQRKSGFMDNV